MRPYVLYNLLSLVLCVIYIYYIGKAHWSQNASEFLIGKLMLTHSMMTSKVLTAFVMLEVYTCHLLDRCLLAWSALGRRMTINEF